MATKTIALIREPEGVDLVVAEGHLDRPARLETGDWRVAGALSSPTRPVGRIGRGTEHTTEGCARRTGQVTRNATYVERHGASRR
jgi:hypothetical protein